MDDLTLTFAKARFGEELVKKAFGPQLMEQMQEWSQLPELADNKRKLRDIIEQSVRAEQKKRQEAKKLISYGKERLTDPNRMGGLGTLSLDVLRSLIPGLSISAATGEGIKKTGAEKDEKPEKRAPGRLFDVAHALAAAGGAGTGLAAQKGLFGGVYGKGVAEQMAGGAGELRTQLLNELFGAPAGRGGRQGLAALFEQAAQGGHDIGLAAQRHTPFINRITRLFSMPYWRARFAGAAAEPTAAVAREALEQAVTQAAAGQNIPAGEVQAVMGRLPRALSNVLNAAGSRIHGGAEGTIGRMPGGWKGALIGAALVSAPFAIYRLLKTRSLRRRGGTAAQSAAEKAERLLAEAGQLRESRKELLSSPEQKKKKEKGAA